MVRTRRRLSRLLRQLDKGLAAFEKAVVSWGIIAVALLLIAGVFARKVLNHSFTFTAEIAALLTIVITFIGIAYGGRVGRHIRMSAVFDLMPQKVKKVMILIINAVTCVMMFVLTFYAYQYFKWEHKLEVLTPALQIPVEIFVAFAVVGFFLAGVEYLKNFVVNLGTPIVYVASEKQDVSETQDGGGV